MLFFFHSTYIKNPTAPSLQPQSLGLQLPLQHKLRHQPRVRSVVPPRAPLTLVQLSYSASLGLHFLSCSLFFFPPVSRLNVELISLGLGVVGRKECTGKGFWWDWMWNKFWLEWFGVGDLGVGIISLRVDDSYGCCQAWFCLMLVCCSNRPKF